MAIESDGQIQKDLYRKLCTENQYISPDSAHSWHIFSNIPKSLVHRIVRIVSLPGMRKVRLEERRKQLLSRGYKAGELRKVNDFGMKIDRDKALEKVRKEEKNEGRVRYTVTYPPKLPHLPAILGKNWRLMLESDKRLQRAFPAPPMVFLKRGKNLGDKLIRARLPK